MEQEIITDIDSVNKYLLIIDKIFTISDLINKNVDKKNIISYYHNSSTGYKFFHSKEGSVHMALNYDGVFDEAGYLTQAKEISSLINAKTATNILELACGKGFNSIFLAKQFPNIQFQGIDITRKHLAIANKKAKHLENVTFSYGDFHDLEFHDSTFDIIFELESVCYAFNLKKVLEGVYAKLKKNGIFILYYGFRLSGFEQLPEELKKAAILSEKSMAVNSSLTIDEWLKIAVETRFKVISCENISEAIMPTLGRFQKLARSYFKYPLLSKILLGLFPREMIMNSIAGLLMPVTVHNRAQGYYKIILEKG